MKPGLPALISKNPVVEAVLDGGWWHHRRRRLTFWLLAVMALFLVRCDLSISGDFTVYPDHNADIRTPIEGLIAAIAVREGEAVAEGQVIARIDAREYRARQREIEADIARARAERQLVVNGARSETLTIAEREVETAQTRVAHADRLFQQAFRLHNEDLTKARQTVDLAESEVEFAREDEARNRDLAEDGWVAKSQLDEVQRQLAIDEGRLQRAHSDLATVAANTLADEKREQALAENELKEAEARLAMLAAGSRAEELDAMDADIARLVAALELVESRLAQSEILSPITGIVVTERIEEKNGQRVAPGDMIGEVYDFTAVKAEIMIPEKEVGVVEVGQAVTLKARAYPSRSFQGRVVAIAPRAVISQDGLNLRLVRVTTEIDNPDLVLKPDMTGNAKINGPSRSLFSLITRRLVRYLKVEFWSWW